MKNTPDTLRTEAPRAVRSARLGVRATPEQERTLRRAAEVAQKSLTEFILDSACRAAEDTLLDQRLFVVSGDRHQALLDLLDQPATDNPGLRDLFSRPDPWAAPPGEASATGAASTSPVAE
jgi:uncharacterized protein (DUF1778 family)